MLYTLLIVLSFSLSQSEQEGIETYLNSEAKIVLEGEKEKERLTKKLIAKARSLRGAKYKYGSGSAKKGYDCSGLIQSLYKTIQIDLPRTAAAQATKGKKVKLKNLQTGDLLFFKNGKKINHVAMILEKNSRQTIIIHSTSSKGVIFEDLKRSKYWNDKISFARRLI